MFEVIARSSGLNFVFDKDVRSDQKTTIFLKKTTIADAMNVLLMSVAERTREIGLRRAIGARQRDIRNQFLAEALVLSVGGGLLGLIFGYSCVLLANQTGQVTAVLRPGVVVGSCGLALVMGLLCGVYPAQRAAKLQPINALRSE